jgi:hypothetical protein
MDGPEHRAVIWAAGLAAAVLVGILVFAVVRTSTDSVRPPGPVTPATSVAGTSATARPTSSSTSYTVPSVQTSQAGAPVVSDPATVPVDEAPALDDPAASSSTPTVSNPYNTTTPTNAGHI